MYRWSGTSSSASLPTGIEKELRRRIEDILNSHGFSGTQEVVQELTDQVSYAFAGRRHTLRRKGPGRPPSGPEMLLSANVADVLKKHGVQGNWQTWPGQAGPVAEIEAVAQSAFRIACGGKVGTLTRPARITEARRTLGNIYRSELPPSKFKPNN